MILGNQDMNIKLNTHSEGNQIAWQLNNVFFKDIKDEYKL